MFLRALKLLIPVTCKAEVGESGMSPLHSAAAGGHSQCLKVNCRSHSCFHLHVCCKWLLASPSQALLDAGYDPNYMLHPWVRRSYDDERKSALFFAVSNNDVTCAELLLEAGAMTNQDPVKCLQVPACVPSDQNMHSTCKEDVLAGPHNSKGLFEGLVQPIAACQT